MKAVLDVFKDKLVKRGVSFKALDAGEPQASGKVYPADRHDQAGHRPGQREEDHQDHSR